MNEQQKRQAIFITVISVILIVAIALVIYFFKKGQDDKVGVVINSPMSEDPLYKEATEKLANKDYSFDRGSELSRQWTAEDLQKMGMVFAERLGSYSSDSNYANLLDLKLFMTSEMSLWADSYVKTLQGSRDKETEYYGISTLAVAGEITNFDSEVGTASGYISTQRKELRGASSKTFNQNLDIKFLKINNEWKVDSASWVK